MRKLGIPASLAFCTADMEASAPALSRMMAAALREIAVSNSWFCLFASSSCTSTRVSYPSDLARASAASASALKNGLSCDGVIIAISLPLLVPPLVVGLAGAVVAAAVVFVAFAPVVAVGAAAVVLVAAGTLVDVAAVPP